MSRIHGHSWERLDNTANLFPVIASDSLTNTYRISVVLKEEVREDILQRALDILLPRFPGFNLRIRSGIFWFYLEENGKPSPRVHEENTMPCRFIHGNESNSYLFRVTYYKKRINLEVFHALADGMGGLTFLRELTYQYLRIAHKELEIQYGEGLSSETSLNREDSFRANYKEGKKSTYKIKKAFLIHGDKLTHRGFGVIQGIMPLDQLKSVCRDKYHVTMNDYLVSAFVAGVYKAFSREISQARPVRVAVPVNLRPFFNSITTKNFFVMVSAEFYPDKPNRDYSFSEICTIIHESLKAQITKDHLEDIFSYNVSNEEYFIARAVPLPIKNIAMRIIYTKSALANTTTITNMGNVTVLDGYRPYIDMFHCFLTFSKGQKIKGTIMSYGEKLAYSITSEFGDTAIQREIFRQIASDGVDVSIETNGVYYHGQM